MPVELLENKIPEILDININATNHIFVTQTNALGITSEPIHIEVINITVELDPLTISATDTSNTSIGNHTITVSGAETDSEVTVTATHSTGTVVTNTSTGNGDIIIALPNSGVWTLSAVQTDEFNNESAVSNELTITLDSNAPIISVATLSGTTVSNTNAVVVTVTGFIAGETITVTATPADTTQTTQTGTIDTSTTSRDVTLTLVDGVWSISAVQTISGETNPSDTSTSQSITVDTVAPAFSSITVPAATPTAKSKDVTIALSGTDHTTVTYSAFLTTVSDNATCAATDDSLFIINTEEATPNTFTLTLESDNGNYICVKATDEAGNTTKQISTSTIGGIDTTAPTFTIAVPAATPTAQSKNVTLTLTNTEPSTVTYSAFLTTDSSTDCANSDDSLFTIDTTTSTSNTFTLTLESDNGNYICVKATDEAGNTTKMIEGTNTISGIDKTGPSFTTAFDPETSVPSQTKTVTLTNTNSEVGGVIYSYFFITESEKANCPTSGVSLFSNTVTGNTFTLNDQETVDVAGNPTNQLSILYHPSQTKK